MKLLFALMLVIFGGLLAWEGGSTIGREHCEVECRPRDAFDRDSQGIQVFDGAEAIRFGSGLMSFGVMLVIWGVGLAAVLAQSSATDGRSRLSLGFRWLSLVCLFITIICIFPPWRLRSISFFTVIVLVLAYVFVASNATRKKWVRFLFMGLSCATVIAGSLDTGTGICIVLGFFASVAICVHLLLLFPQLLREAFM